MWDFIEEAKCKKIVLSNLENLGLTYSYLKCNSTCILYAVKYIIFVYVSLRLIMFSFILSTALALPQSYSISPIAMVEPENEEVSDDSQEEKT